MLSIRSLSATENTQSSQGTEQTKQSSVAKLSDSFDSLLAGLLGEDQTKEVSEEELFSAMLVERVAALKGEDAGKEFQELLKTTEKDMTTSTGYVPYEDAARLALKKYEEAGKLTAEEADEVHSEAFGAAQLDSNINALYDGHGGANDPTRAVGAIGSALASAKSIIEKYVAGTESVISRPISVGLGRMMVNPYDSTGAVTSAASTTSTGGSNTPNGTTMDGADGFLFKPVSSNDGKLAVLLPGDISAAAISCVLKDATGNVIEEGYHWAPGFGAEGGGNPRKKFSFTKPGASYPDNLTVEATLSNGATMTWQIPDPAKRYD